MTDMTSGIPGWALLAAGFGVSALAFGVSWYRNVRTENRRLVDAIDNMSQGLNMFDAQTRIVLVNRQYLEMYKLSPDIVKPGCTLRQLIEHRKDTGLFVDDVDAYCQRILDSMNKGASTYSAKVMEFLKANTTASLDFAQELISVKSPSEALELWTTQTRKQLETFTAQAKELAELGQKIAAEAAEPIKATASKFYKPAA